MITKLQNLNIRWFSQVKLNRSFIQIRPNTTQSTQTTSPESIQFLPTLSSSHLIPFPSSSSSSNSPSTVTTTSSSSSSPPIKSIGQYRAYSPQHFYNNRVLEKYAYQSIRITY
ncbi:unnamed protein product [Rhizophagus irregularis]|nr:unnamed protein product [Rhizophagus irregularis]CAB5348538.1 unnamed protein product [Rhizophagus irregularis]